MHPLIDKIGEVQTSVWINSKGWVDTQFEEENGCLLAFPNWQETQTTSLLKLLHDTSNWNWLRTQEITSID